MGLNLEGWSNVIDEGSYKEYDNYITGFGKVEKEGLLFNTVRVFVCVDKISNETSVKMFWWKSGDIYGELDEDSKLGDEIKQVVKESQFYKGLNEESGKNGN